MTVTTTNDDGVLVVALDDGKMNALTHDVVDQLHAALDTAKASAQAVCIRGNDRALSAGFDLAVMTGPVEGMRKLVTAGAELLLRLYVHPQPTVAAVTGHALAGGALLALVCDTRVAADQPSKIGLNEVAIGLALPEFAYELAAARLSKRYLTRAAIQAEIFDVAGALAAGYVDRVEPPASCAAVAVAEARRLAEIPGRAYAHTKRSLRQPLVDRLLAGLTADLDGLGLTR